MNVLRHREDDARVVGKERQHAAGKERIRKESTEGRELISRSPVKRLEIRRDDNGLQESHQKGERGYRREKKKRVHTEDLDNFLNSRGEKKKTVLDVVSFGGEKKKNARGRG